MAVCDVFVAVAASLTTETVLFRPNVNKRGKISNVYSHIVYASFTNE